MVEVLNKKGETAMRDEDESGPVGRSFRAALSGLLVLAVWAIASGPVQAAPIGVRVVVNATGFTATDGSGTPPPANEARLRALFTYDDCCHGPSDDFFVPADEFSLDLDGVGFAQTHIYLFLDNGRPDFIGFGLGSDNVRLIDLADDFAVGVQAPDQVLDFRYALSSHPGLVFEANTATARVFVSEPPALWAMAFVGAAATALRRKRTNALKAA